MKKKMTILSTMLISLTLFASDKSYTGSYSTPSLALFYGFTEQECNEDKGDFEEAGSSCYKETENIITIKTNQVNQNIIKISVIYGPSNKSNFSGVATNIVNNALIVQEAIINEDGSVDSLIKGGCTLSVQFSNNNKATLKLGKNCDIDLERASGALKK